MANWYVEGHEQPDNINLIEIIPLEFHRRHEGLTRTKMRQPYTKLASDAQRESSRSNGGNPNASHLRRVSRLQCWLRNALLTADRSTNKGCLIFAGDMRQLHRLQHQAGHIRSRYGGTISAGFKRGSIVKHPKHGICYVGGWTESPTKKDPERKTISLHNPKTGKRLAQNAVPDDCKFFAYNSWRIA